MFGQMYDALTYFYALSRDDSGQTTETSKESGSDSDGGSWQMSDEMPNIDPILVISGTSLNLDKLRENLATFLTDTWGAIDPPVTNWEAYLVHDNFPLVSSDEDFWSLYQHHLTNIISESSRNQDSLDVNSASRLPLLSRSGRPLPLPDSNHGLDVVQLRKWLWRPLDVAPLSEILTLLGQIYRLTMNQEPRQPYNKDRYLFADLETALDHSDSDQVASALALQIVHPLSHSDPQQLEPFCKQVLRMLADFHHSNTDKVSRMVRDKITDSTASDSSFQELAETLHQHLRNAYIRQLIASHSISHRGRYRWSTIYIEELMSLSRNLASGSSSLAEIRSAVEQARNKTYKAAVEALKGQIRKMKASGKTELADELFRAGIRAEMMSIPTIFLDQSYAQLVTYGFALIQRDGETVKYTFAEPIAVHAVMDYLRTEGKKDYSKLMLQWLIHTQEDHEVQAMFGKATEWFIAMSLDRMLRKQVDDSNLPDLLDGSGSARREALLRQLAESVSIHPQVSKLKSVVQVDDLALPESPIVYKYHTPNTIWDWMKYYRTEGQKSTSAFMFPDTKAGPDLVFILENQSATRNEEGQDDSTRLPFRPADKILVAAQIKTGRSANFEKAMETLLSSNWHSNMGKNAREDELAHWAGTRFLLLLICTGITVKQDKINEWMRSNSKRITEGHFFCVLDETVTSDIWGQDFVALAEAIKTKKFEQPVSEGEGKRGRQNHAGGTLGTQIPDRSRKRARNS
ncbi:hypothetical protein ACHAPT_004732 [Fusarium lateritium]